MFKNLYQKHKEKILYLFFGGLSFILNILLFLFIVNFCKLDVLVANLISWIIVVAFCFITNKIWVFKKSSDKLLKQIFSFYISRIITLFIEELILFIFIIKLGLNDTFIKVIAQIIVIVVNYFFSKFMVFKK